MSGVSYVVEGYAEFDDEEGLKISSDCRELEPVSEEESMVSFCAALEALAEFLDSKLPEVRMSEVVGC